MHHSSKADLLKCLEPFTPSLPSPPEVDVKHFDGAALVHTLEPENAVSTVKTFKDYAEFFALSIQTSSHCQADRCSVGLIQCRQLKGTFERVQWYRISFACI